MTEAEAQDSGEKLETWTRTLVRIILAGGGGEGGRV